jgi:hypothetical protein
MVYESPIKKIRRIFIEVVDSRELNKNPPDFWAKSGGFFGHFFVRSLRFQKIRRIGKNPPDFCISGEPNAL